MGEVWLGEDPRLHRQVAVKTLPLRSQLDQEFLQRFEREARAAAALNHPHILPVHDYGEQAMSDGQTNTYIVMTYVSGGTLAGRLMTLSTHNRLMPHDEAMSYLSQAAQAIDYAHGQNVLHRDIKPSNMLLRNDGWLLLTDFGIARILSDQSNLTQTGVGIGTPEYMAPEQAKGRAEAASDNYSLAVIAYQIFTGNLPFQAETPYALTVQHIMTQPPPPREVNQNLSLAVEQALLHGLAKEPALRPFSASAFVAALQHALTDPSLETTLIRHPIPETADATTNPSHERRDAEGGSGNSPQLPVTPTLPAAIEPPASKGWVTRRQVLIGGGAALLLAGGLGAWGFASRHTSSSPPLAHTSRPAINPNMPALSLLAHTQPISSLAWSPTESHMLASAGKDSQVMLWDVPAIAQGQASKIIPQAKQHFNSTTYDPVLLAWSAGGDALAIANASSTPEANGQLFDMTIKMYKNDLSAPDPRYDESWMTFLRTLDITDMTWGPGTNIITITKPYELAGKSKYRLEFRDPLDPKFKLKTIWEFGFGYSVTVSPADQSTVAMGILEGVLVGQPLLSASTAQWKSPPLMLTFDKTKPGFVKPASSVTWSPDGQYVASITNPIFIPKYIQSQLNVWNIAKGDSSRLALSLPTSGTVLTKLAWSPAPTSTLLAAGSQDGAVYLWQVNPGSLEGNALPIRSLIGLSGAQVTALAWSADGHWLAAGYNDTNDSVLIWKI
jgi:serine/threonine protein kinase